jgi:hypothetical protein
VEEIVNFTATLTGADEVPARATPATGTASATLDTATHFFTLRTTFQDSLGEETAARIHAGAPGVTARFFFRSDSAPAPDYRLERHRPAISLTGFDEPRLPDQAGLVRGKRRVRSGELGHYRASQPTLLGPGTNYALLSHRSRGTDPHADSPRLDFCR